MECFICSPTEQCFCLFLLLMARGKHSLINLVQELQCSKLGSVMILI